MFVTYASYEALVDDYAKRIIPFEEYRKYFGKLYGLKFDGYPDFTEKYFESMGAATAEAVKEDTKRRDEFKEKSKHKPKITVVRHESPENIRVYSFDTMKSARAYLSEIVRLGGTYDGVDRVSNGDTHYTLCVSEHEPDIGLLGIQA